MSKEAPIDRAAVVHVAKLARLTVTDAEADALTRDMQSILAYVKKLDELDVREVAATSHAVHLETLLRPDEPRPCMPLEKVIANSPERIGDGFGVPKIIE
ncbi:MAG: Asp-tRNA(Asn)/Glu-tRNA(Gln) amidotransferase subunit GatC [Myxococcota bacterium]